MERIRLYKYCLRCGRRLRSEDARVRGMGKTCYEKARVRSVCRLFNADTQTKENDNGNIK